MGQAFDDRGNPLGPGVFGDTKRDVFDKLQNLHPAAHEYRIKSLNDRLDDEEKQLAARGGTTGEASDPRTAASGEGFHRRRTEHELRAVVSMLCHFIWHQHLRPGEHLWSIPVDPER